MKNLTIKKLYPLMDQAVVSGGNFILGVVLARTLGLAFYGKYTLIWLVVLFCSSIHHAWIITPMYTFAPKYGQEKKEAYIQSMLVHQFIFALLAMLLVSILLSISKYFFPSWGFEGNNLIISLTVFSYLMYDFFRRLSYVRESVKKAFILDVFVYALQGVLLFMLYFHNQLTLINCLYVVCISYSISFLTVIKTLKSFRIDVSFCIETTIKHWRFSRWLIGTALLQWVSGNFFILAAGGLLGPVIVGAIRIIQNIMGVLHVLFLALENSVPITAARVAKSEGIQRMFTYLKGITIKGGVMTFVLVTLLALFGKQLISFLYAGKYIEYAYLLYGFGVLYIFVFIGTNFRFAIRTVEKTRAIFIAYVLSTLFSLLSAKMIIQQFGIMGVLIGLIATQLIMQGYFIYTLKKVCKPKKSLI